MNQKIFRQTGLQKCGKVNNCSFVLRLVRRMFEETLTSEIEQHFGGFFNQIKVRQPIGRKDSTVYKQ
jgi:hypothetical protein